MSSKQFTQKQKLSIVKSAAEIGIKQASEVAGVHYTTVYDWRRKLGGLGEDDRPEAVFKPSCSPDSPEKLGRVIQLPAPPSGDRRLPGAGRATDCVIIFQRLITFFQAPFSAL